MLKEEGYDVVCGSRFVEGGSVENYPLIKLIINRFWNNVFAFLFKLNVKDISNAFKAYRKEVIAKTKPKSKGFEITAEIVLKARIMGQDNRSSCFLEGKRKREIKVCYDKNA